MASADLRGGKLDIRATPPNGVKIDCQYTSDGSSGLSLANATVVGYLMDDDGSPVSSHNMTITDDAEGEFLLLFPASSFADLWGQDISYVVQANYAAESAPTPLIHGFIRLQEAR